MASVSSSYKATREGEKEEMYAHTLPANIIEVSITFIIIYMRYVFKYFTLNTHTNTLYLYYKLVILFFSMLLLFT